MNVESSIKGEMSGRGTPHAEGVTDESLMHIDSGAADEARRKRRRLVLMLAAPVLLAIGALYFYLSGGRYESTENASLQTTLVAISPSVSGKVVAVHVTENQLVKAGDMLFQISPQGFEARVAAAEAELAEARADIGSLQAEYREALSEVGAAQARRGLAAQEAARQRSLLGEGISSRAQYDAAVTNARTSGDAIVSAQARAESLRARLSGRTSGSADGLPAVRKAEAELSLARRDLSNSSVRAPQQGIVTRVNQVQIGSFAPVGRPMFMLAGTKFWVQANFKEDQLRYMRVGQPVAIEVDAFPDDKLKGRVASFSPGTGSSFAVLPPENATGNWVKVTQRVPVQIAIDEVPAGLPLSAGLSVAVEVDTGHQRHLFGPDTPPSNPRVRASDAAVRR